jgi:hypothetical protein
MHSELGTRSSTLGLLDNPLGGTFEQRTKVAVAPASDHRAVIIFGGVGVLEAGNGVSLGDDRGVTLTDAGAVTALWVRLTPDEEPAVLNSPP